VLLSCWVYSMKCQLTFNGLLGTISQQTAVFTTIALSSHVLSAAPMLMFWTSPSHIVKVDVVNDYMWIYEHRLVSLTPDPFDATCNDKACKTYSWHTKQTMWLLVRKRTIPTGRPPHADKIWCQLLWIEGCRVVSVAEPLHSRWSQFSRPEQLLFFQVAPYLSSQGLPRSRPTATQKI
jgi:hypothetical protein